MNKIKRLNIKLSEAQKLLAELQERVNSDTDNFALKMSFRTVQNHVSDIQSQLQREKELREKEVIELHLDGHIAKDGTIPLSVLSNISQHLSETVLSAAQHLKLGEKSRGRIKTDIAHTLNLRFAGISPGSTKLYITGNTSPDLFGFSLIEESLNKTFKILETKKANELVDSVTDIGLRSTKNLNKLLKAINNSDLEMTLKWCAPDQSLHKWKGDAEKITTLTNTFESLQTTTPTYLEVRGELIMASLKGQFEIKDETEKIYRGTFPAILTEDVKELHLGEHCFATLERTIIKNKVTGYQKTSYSLKTIKAHNQRL